MAIATTINLSSLDGNNGFSLDGVSGLVSNAGDINGDGFDDVVINNYVVFGKDSGFDSTLDLFSLDGNNGFRLVGGGRITSVSNAGDINGDGFDDVIIGASNYYYHNPDGFSGFVVFGRASGFDASVDLLSLDGNNGFTLNGSAIYNSQYSTDYAVSSAGDVNGDGFDDVIIGGANVYGGGARVVFGKAAGFGAGIPLGSLDGNNGFTLLAKYDYTVGYSVSSAGDVNGDGFDDVIVGSHYGDRNGSDSGVSYVVFGKATGFDAGLDLHSLDGSNGFRLNGVANDRSGFSVSNAGDVNGDGFDDLIIAAPKDRSSDGPSGSAYVVFGKASGFDATMDLSSVDGNNGFRLDGIDAGILSFNHLASNAGDVNGDGFDDLIIGSDEADPNGDDSGSSYVVFGKASGFSATIDLFSLDSNTGVRLDGSAAGDNVGRSVSGAGDVNGDGFDDLIVGAYRDFPRLASSYVIFGRSDFGSGNVIAGTPGSDKLTGTPAAEIFEAGDGNDRMIGRGGADVFHGGAGDDYIQVTDLGFASVDGGSGNDTLHTDGKDLNLDLGIFGDKIHGIETICLYGRGDNELTLTAEDLLNLSDTDNTLRVNGNAGDHVTVLDDGWVDEGSRGQGYFHVYTNDDAVLLVGMNVTVDFA